MTRLTHVLIVEDSRTVLTTYSRVLNQAGYAVLEASTGAKAMEILQECPPDIVLLDRVLPDIDGEKICARIKQNPALEKTFVIILSALKTTADDRVSGLEAGADDYVVKPLGPRELLARVRVAERLLHAQQAIQDSEAKFRTLAENSPDIIIRIGLDGQFLYVNPSIETITGIPRDEFIGKTTAELGVDADSVNFWETTLADVFTSGQAKRVDYPISIGDTFYWFDIKLVPEFAEDGSGTSILAVMRDYTEHKQAQEEIARLATVIEQAVESVIISDTDGKVLYANAAFENLIGFSKNTIRGSRLSDFSCDDGRPCFEETFIRAFTAGTEWQGVTHLLSQDTTGFEIETTIFPILDGNNKQLNVAALLRNVTERQRAKRERDIIATVATSLRKATTYEEMLPIILDQTMELLHIIGATITTLSHNSESVIIDLVRGQHVFPEGTVIPADRSLTPQVIESGKPYRDNEAYRHLTPDQLGNAPDKLKMSIQAIAGVPLIAHQRKTGVLWVSSMYPISDQTMNILNAIGEMAASAMHRAALYEELQHHAADLEKRVAERTQELATANEQLRELDRLKTRFVSNVSHELRTPISSLKLYLSLLRKGQAERRARYEEALQLSTERLGQLVEDILNLSRLDVAHYQPEEFEPTDMNAIARQIVKLHRAQGDAAGIKLQFAPDESLPLVYADYNQLSQMINNLVVNALNYTSKGYVTIWTQNLATDRVLLGVEDSGIGILPEDKPYVFDRFYRGSQLNPDDIPGTGLGLAIVKEIVAIHNGKITLESEVDVGTKITVQLPRSRAPDQMDEARPRRAKPA